MSGREPDMLRCERCGRGVHPEEAMHIKATDQNVCPRCYDEWAAEYGATEEDEQ